MRRTPVVALLVTLLAASAAAGAGFSSSVAPIPSRFQAAPVFAPRPLTPPAISGSAVEGRTLTASPGTWARGVDAIHIRWLRCADACTAVGDGPTRDLTAADVGRQMRIEVTVTNAGGSTVRTSEPTTAVQPIPAPAFTTAPAITGVATVGAALTASDGAFGPPGTTVTRRWQRCFATCTPIPGESDPTYLVTGDDAGATIKLEVSASNSSGAATASATPTAAVKRATYTQLVCANPATGLGVAADGALPDGLRTSGSIANRFDPRPTTRCAAGTTGTGVPLSTGAVFTTTTPDDRIVLEYRTLPNVEFAGATIYRHGTMSGRWSWSVQTATATGLYAMPRLDLCSWGNGCTTRGSATQRFAAENRVEVAAGPVDGFNLPLSCDIAWGGTCSADGSQVVRLFGGSVTLRDTATPALGSAVGGSLAGAGPLAASETLAFAASDAGGGLYRVRVRIGDEEVAAVPVAAGQSTCTATAAHTFTHRRPCPLTASSSLTFDTTGWPRTGRLRVLLEDAGRNTTVLVNRLL